MLVFRAAPQVFKALGFQVTQAVFLQDSLTVLDNLTVYLGARYDRWENKDGFQEAVDSTGFTRTEFDDQSRNSFNPKVAVVYSPFDSTNVRASAIRRVTSNPRSCR